MQMWQGERVCLLLLETQALRLLPQSRLNLFDLHFLLSELSELCIHPVMLLGIGANKDGVQHRFSVGYLKALLGSVDLLGEVSRHRAIVTVGQRSQENVVLVTGCYNLSSKQGVSFDSVWCLVRETPFAEFVYALTSTMFSGRV
eukprot:TRINITY_DN44233_c0_g1_i1.p1 TRINITY_DN44233_c0_g1~~TRINITY_DN44233_c0_g1_i1.p1  ORF type:complete len:144 (-),score=2.69 TRINITY_DN44233_c0_g1_i1:1-432(-)